MAIQSQPSRISEPFAGSGSKNVIPATNSTPSASQAASWASGFPPECSQPISAGGCPVPRDDVNGVLNWLSQGFAFGQDGGVWAWSALADYDTQRLVRGSDGLLYWSVAQSGPNVGGAVDPTTDDGTHWAPPQFKTLNVYDESTKGATTQWVKNFLSSRAVQRTLYVDSVNGSDSNDGKTAATAFKTVEHAQGMATSGDYMFFTPSYLEIHLAMGSYGKLIGLPGCNVSYICDSPDEGTVCTGVEARGSGATVYIKGKLTIDNGSIFAYCNGAIYILDGSTLVFRNISTVCFDATNNATISIAYTDSAFVWFGLNVNPSSAAVRVMRNSVIDLSGTMTFGGSNSGQRYNVVVGSRLTGVGSSTAIPGTTGNVDSSSTFS